MRWALVALMLVATVAAHQRARAQTVLLHLGGFALDGRNRTCDLNFTLSNHAGFYFATVSLAVEVTTRGETALHTLNFFEIPPDGRRDVRLTMFDQCGVSVQVRVMRVLSCRSDTHVFDDCGARVGGTFIGPTGNRSVIGPAVR